jgi:hypothetical protein
MLPVLAGEFDAPGTGVLSDAIALAGGPKRVITLSDPGRRGLRRHALRGHARPCCRRPGSDDRPAGRGSAPPARAHNHADAADRRRPPPAGKRYRPRRHHPRPALARAAHSGARDRDADWTSALRLHIHATRSNRRSVLYPEHAGSPKGLAAYIPVALIWLIPERRVERTLTGAHEDSDRIPL